MEAARKGKAPCVVDFPLSAIIQLRPYKKAKDSLSLTVNFPDKQTVTYQVPVINVQAYTLDEICEKGL